MLTSPNIGYFPTCDGHQLYWERHGTPGTEPVFFLHGGPGGRSSRHHLEFFDLCCFDIILFDQRGGGRSMPQGQLQHNNTGQCVEDIDALRRYFGFQKISLLGVSWGSWLAIQYQQRYPDALLKTTLVSVFVPFAQNVRAYDKTLSDALAGPRARSIYQILNNGCEAQQRQAAIGWLKAILKLNGQSMDPSALEHFADQEAVRAIRLELHYHVNHYFFTHTDEGLVVDANTEVIQGTKDRFGMASLRWLRQRQSIRCRLLHAGHNAFDRAIVKTVRHSLKRGCGTNKKRLPKVQ
ncbi:MULTISPECIES: alpha/beta fold hydrolase [unclassified Pseudomonas]|uniref:alpha/beta fold hydrolase n=1 Tax=unclassified Pseudomonas TaxID=196821 RepID=UPI002AC911DF|nr:MULTISPECIES: alpha/beta fold hydrolase [unclassified Pseudomonas]MEB0046579.1 alpha/beta fold hydrolase [Pseudomonas sp. Dout3]MEB0095345.1 alpha/beta fold hydrolase [Pseudomonas sp. DC1.2]WPX60930.1 alpha/beta fold hydrolase [Pseudomonas sp. DC1.2]